MTTPPPKLYLQWHGDGEPDDPGEVFAEHVTHSFEQVYKHDVEYVRADIAERTRQLLRREIDWFNEVLGDQVKSLDAATHFIIETGLIPGIDTSCRCDGCAQIARQMDAAGYLTDVTDRWWEEKYEKRDD